MSLECTFEFPRFKWPKTKRCKTLFPISFGPHLHCLSRQVRRELGCKGTKKWAKCKINMDLFSISSESTFDVVRGTKKAAKFKIKEVLFSLFGENNKILFILWRREWTKRHPPPPRPPPIWGGCNRSACRSDTKVSSDHQRSGLSSLIEPYFMFWAWQASTIVIVSPSIV